MFWRRKHAESQDPLDSLARSLVREAGLTETEVEITASRVSFSGVQARIEREILTRSVSVDRGLLSSTAAWQAAGASALVTIVASAALVITEPVAPDPSLDRLLMGAGSSRASGGSAPACGLSAYSGCALSNEEMLATIVAKDTKE